MEELKSGELKAEPSPYKPVSEKVRAVSMEMVKDGYDWFTGLVAERRQLPMPRVDELSDGRVYTGRQAIAVKLIDELGGEERRWPGSKRRRSVAARPAHRRLEARAPPANRTGLRLRRRRHRARALGLEGLENAVAESAKLDGLLVLWHPAH